MIPHSPADTDITTEDGDIQSHSAGKTVIKIVLYVIPHTSNSGTMDVKSLVEWFIISACSCRTSDVQV